MGGSEFLLSSLNVLDEVCSGLVGLPTESFVHLCVGFIVFDLIVQLEDLVLKSLHLLLLCLEAIGKS